MSIIVQKYGGTSLASLERIETVAHRVLEATQDGHQVVVVVSAMAGVTNQLVDWVDKSCLQAPDACEYDVVVSTGEQVTSGLMALRLQTLGLQARSFLGWQLPILTTQTHRKARILSIDTNKLQDCLNQGQIAVVSGFQGVDSEGRLTTLGRGGSDTTAVALAQALNAQRCEIYTDVEGVFTADPRIVTNARKISEISYEEMSELAWQGAKVLQPGSADLAMKHQVPLEVLSSFTRAKGTVVTTAPAQKQEPRVRGIASNMRTARVHLVNLPNYTDIQGILTTPLADLGVRLDMPIRNTSDRPGYFCFSFSIAQEDIDIACAYLDNHKNQIQFDSYGVNQNVAKIALVGPAIGEVDSFRTKMLDVFASLDISVQVCTAKGMAVNVIVSPEKAELAVKSLHQEFGLQKEIELKSTSSRAA